MSAAPENPALEDLTAFLDVKRWGLSLREVNARIAAEEAQRQGRRSGLNPALKELGYVGLVVEADANTVLLTTTEGTVARLEPGDALLDGRILAAVEGNSITLRAANGGELEVLETVPASADASGGWQGGPMSNDRDNRPSLDERRRLVRRHRQGRRTLPIATRRLYAAQGRSVPRALAPTAGRTSRRRRSGNRRTAHRIAH